jgi:hypothetical protein
MGKTYTSLTPQLREWLAQQKVFFVATAPLAQEGHINCSPKGYDTFRVLGEQEVAYFDLTGSGIETIAHLQENGRIVLMFCAFSGPPKIVRLHGTGQVIYPDHSDFSGLQASFPGHAGVRAIIRVKVERISDSCGHGVPLMDFVQHRDLIEKWSASKGPHGMAEYREAKNRASIDGLPGYAGPSQGGRHQDSGASGR